MNPQKTACLDVALSPSSSPTPLFTPSDFAPLNCPKRARPSPTPLIQRTVFQPGDDWHSPSATTVIDYLHNNICQQAEANNHPSAPLSLCRSSAAVEVDASAADLFTPLIQPFPKQQRLIQCASCRRPLLITRLFQHLPHCPARNSPNNKPSSSRTDPMLDLIAAPYNISPPSSPRVRKRPRVLPSASGNDSNKIKNSSNKHSKHDNKNSKQHDGNKGNLNGTGTKRNGLSTNQLHTPPTDTDHRFAPPREEDNWRKTLIPLAPPFKPISKYRRRRVSLPPPYEPTTHRKRTPAAEKKALSAAAAAYVQNIPARSPTHQHQANSRDPLRNAVTKAASAFPWAKVIQLALPIPSSRNLSSNKNVTNLNYTGNRGTNANGNNNSASRKSGGKDSAGGSAGNNTSAGAGLPPGGRNSTGNASYPSSPPVTPRLSGSSIDPVELELMATNHPVPSLAAALLYLRGQGLRPLAHTTVSSLDPPTQPLIRPAPAPIFHGQKIVANLGAYRTDSTSFLTKFKLPEVTPLYSHQPPSAQQTPATQQVQQANASHHTGPRPGPTDPRLKKANNTNGNIPAANDHALAAANSSGSTGTVHNSSAGWQTPSAVMTGASNGGSNTNLPHPKNNDMSSTLSNTSNPTNNNLTGMVPGTAAAMLHSSANINNVPNSTNPNAAVGMNTLPPGSINSNINMSGAMAPPPHTVNNTMQGISPAPSNPDVSNLSQHSGYANSMNLPPPSPSTSIGSRNTARRPSTPSGGLPSDIAMAGGKPHAGRKGSGTRRGASNSNKATTAATNAMMINAQHGRMPSPAGGKLMQSTPSNGPITPGVSLAPAMQANPAYKTNLLPQQQQQHKKMYQSPGRMVVTPPNFTPSSHGMPRNDVPGMFGGSNPMQHLVPGRQGQVKPKDQQHQRQMGMLSPAMGPVSSVHPTSAGKTAVKSPSPSQGSIRSGDMSALHGRQSTGSSNTPYDPMSLTAAIAAGATGVSPGVNTPGNQLSSRNENTATVLAAKKMLNPQVMAQVAAKAGKTALRHGLMTTGAVGTRVAPPNIAGKSPTSGTPAAPAHGPFMPERGVNPLANQGMHGLAVSPDNQAGANVGVNNNPRMNENAMLVATPGLRASVGAKAMNHTNNNPRLAPGGRKDVDVKPNDMEVHIRQARAAQAEAIRMDNTGALKEKLDGTNRNNMQMRMGQNLMGHTPRVSQGYFNLSNGVPPTSNAPPDVSSSATGVHPPVGPPQGQIGPSPQHHPQSQPQPNIGLKGQANSAAAAKLAMYGIQAQAQNIIGSNAADAQNVNSAAAAAAAAVANNPNSALLQGMQDVRSLHGIPPQLMGTSGLQAGAAAAMAAASQQQYNANMLSLLQNGALNASMANQLVSANNNNPSNAGGANPAVTVGIGAGGPNTGGNNVGVNNPFVQVNGQGQGQGQNMVTQDMFQQILSAGRMGQNGGGPSAMGMTAGMSGVGLASGPQGVNGAVNLQGNGLGPNTTAAFNINGQQHSLGLGGQGNLGNPAGMQGQHNGLPMGGNGMEGQQREIAFTFQESDLLDELQ